MFLIASTVTAAVVLLVLVLILRARLGLQRVWIDEEAAARMKVVRRASDRQAA